MLVGAGLFLFGIIASWLGVATIFFLGSCWSAIRAATGSHPISWLKYDVLIMSGCALLATALTVALSRWCALVRPLTGLVLGALSWWLALSLASALWFPNASFLFVWPTLGGLLGLSVSSRYSPEKPMAAAAAFLGSIPSLLLLAPLTRTTFDGLSLPMVQPVLVLVVLSTGALMPLWGLVVALDRRPARITRWKRRAALVLEAEPAS
jgi:hypothetical protein